MTPTETRMKVPSLNVLVVDDQPCVRELTTILLQFLGHKPIAAKSGFEALCTYKVHPIDFILCDIMMPGMDGRAVFENIRNSSGEMPYFCFISGGNYQTELSPIIGNRVGFLQKPYTQRVLGRKIEEMYFQVNES